jgi:hypothetical protein
MGLLAAAILPLIVLIYMLKKKTRPQTVSSILLWERLDRTSTPALKINRLLRNLLFLLQLLTALLIVLAFARPALLLSTGSVGRSHTIVVVDTSYSMAVREEGGTRLELAQQKLQELIRRKGEGETIAIIRMGEQAQLACGFTSDTTILLQTAETIALDGGQANLQEALVLTENLSYALEDPVVVIISDGNCGDRDIRLSMPLVYLPVGMENVHNLQISDMIADGQRLYVTIHNNGTAPAQATMQIQNSSGDIIGQRDVSLEAQTSTALTWRELDGSPWYKAVILTADQVSLDNTYYAVSSAGENQRLLLVSEGNLFLERVFMLQQGLVVTKTRPEQYREELVARNDYFIFDGFLPEILPVAPTVVFDPPHPNIHINTSPPLRPGRIRATAHPLVDYTDFSEVTLGYTKTLRGGQPLLVSDEGTLGAELSHEGYPLLVFGFAVQAGDLPLRPAFPVLMRNITDYFTGLTVFPGWIRFGEPLLLEPSYQVQSVELIDPEGVSEKISAPFPYKGDVVTKTGVYTVIAGENSHPVAVNFPTTTDNLAAGETITAGGNVLTGTEQAPGLWPMITPLLLAAFLFLGLEWWVDNRGA